MRVIFHDGGKRDGEKTAADAEKQGLDTREGERSAKLNRGAPAFLRGNVNGALEAVEDGATHPCRCRDQKTSVLPAEAVLNPDRK